MTIIVEPSDNGSGLQHAIQNAHTSVYMTMYILSANNIINALIGAHQAGKDVKVILNQNFPSGMGSNASVYSQLQGAGVNVVWSSANYTYTHEKTVIIDHQTAWIMTSNAASGAYSGNREYLAVDNVASDVAEAESIFNADLTGASPVINGSLLVAPINARQKKLTLINGAHTSLDMEAEELSDYQIVDALSAAGDRGVAVKIVLADGTPAASQAMAITQLKMHNVSLVTLSNPYIHAKSLVADSSSAYIGSENFTTGSLLHNRELGLIFTEASEVAKVFNTTRTDFGNGTAQ